MPGMYASKVCTTLTEHNNTITQSHHSLLLIVSGRKKWIFYPPSVNPPGVKSSPDGAEVAVPISTGEWLLSFWRYHLEARKHPDVAMRPLEVVLSPGEVMFVPHGYWHMVSVCLL